MTLDIMPSTAGKSDESAYLVLARIGRPRGVEGEFFVRPLADNLERFEKLKEVWLVQLKRRWPTLVESTRLISGRVAIKVAGISTPEEVRPWTNGYLEIEQAERIELAKGNYFHDDLVGLRVISTQGEQLGILVKILEMPANDVYVCRTPVESGGWREFLIPAVEDIVRKIDLSAGQIIIEPLPGLLD